MFLKNDILIADLNRYYGKIDFYSFLKSLRIPGFRYTYIFRQLQNSKKYSIKWLLFRFLYNHYTYKYSFQIPLRTKIGKGLYIGHFGRIIINGNTIIGQNCNISPGVTIGKTNRGKFMGCPIIGDNVWIGTGAIIVGKVIIGNNVLIAPNSYINFNVPDNSIVFGNPGIIHYKTNATQHYINNVLE